MGYIQLDFKAFDWFLENNAHVTIFMNLRYNKNNIE